MSIWLRRDLVMFHAEVVNIVHGLCRNPHKIPNKSGECGVQTTLYMLCYLRHHVNVGHQRGKIRVLRSRWVLPPATPTGNLHAAASALQHNRHQLATEG